MDGGKVIIRIDGDSSDFERSMSKAMANSKSAVGGMTKAFAAVTAAGAGAAAAATKVGMSFEAQMSTVQAISQATSADMQLLTDKAKEMGIKTQFSATEAGQALEYMAMAGWKTEDMLGGIEGVMNLAAASGEDLAATSDIVTDALTAFKLSASDSAHFSDVLAQASSNANTNVGMMGETFKYVAPLAGTMGFNIEDTATAIGLMANSGIKATMAGTALRSIFTRMAKPVKQSEEAMKALNFTAKNSDGSFKSLGTIMKELRSKMKSLTDAEKTQYAAMLGGQEAMSGLLAIVNASESDYAKLETAINNAQGATEKMADTRLDNLQGSVTLLKSSAEGLGIAFYDKFGGKAKEALDGVIEKLNTFTTALSSGELDGAIDGIIVGFVSIGAAIAALNAVVIIQDIINVLHGMEAATKSVAAAQKLLSLTNPYTLILTGVVALGAGIVAYTALHQSEADKRMKKVREELDSYNELKDSVDKKTAANLSEIDVTKNLYGQLQNLVDANGKIKEGQEERVDFILGELNDALGTEYSRTGDIVTNYKNMADEIQNVIAKKQAMILIEGAEEKYKTATENYAEALAAQEKQYGALADKVSEVNELHKGLNLTVEDIVSGNYKNVINKWAEAHANLGYEAQLADDALLHLTTVGVHDANEAYNDASDAVLTYSNDIQKYNDAVVASAEGRYEDVGRILDSENKLYADASAIAADAQGQSVAKIGASLKTALATVKNAQANLQRQNNEYNRAQLKGAQETATGLFDAYLAAGGNSGTALMDGLIENSADFPTITAQLGDEGAQQIREKYPLFFDSGAYTVAGIVAGANSKQSMVSVSTAYYNLGFLANSAFNAACQIKSPAKRFIRSSYWNIMGLVKGVEQYRGKFEAVMRELAGAGIKAFGTENYTGAIKGYLSHLSEMLVPAKSNLLRVQESQNKTLLAGEQKYLDAKKALEDKRVEEEYQRKLSEAKDAEARRKIIDDRQKELREAAEDAEIEALREAAEREREIYDASQKDLENEISAKKDTIISGLRELAEESLDEVSKVKENIDSMANRLGDVQLTRKVRFNMDGKTEEYNMLSLMPRQLNEIREFGAALDKLKAKGNIPKEIIDEIAGKEAVEGIAMANAFLNASPEELENYLNAYEQTIAESERIAKEYYSDDAKNVVGEIVGEFQKTPDEFFEIGKDSIEQFGEGFMENFGNVWRNIRASFAFMVMSAFPELFGGGGTTQNNYSLTVNGEGDENTMSEWDRFLEFSRHMQMRGET